MGDTAAAVTSLLPWSPAEWRIAYSVEPLIKDIRKLSDAPAYMYMHACVYTYIVYTCTCMCM